MSRSKNLHDCTGVLTLYVNSYTLQYSYRNGKIRASIPSDACEISLDNEVCMTELHVSDPFRKSLKRCGWSDKAIRVLERYVLFPDTCMWKGMMRMNPKTGELKDMF